MASLNPKSGVLGRANAAHLLRRATYVPSKANIDAFAAKTVSQAVNDLMIAPALSMTEPIDPDTGQAWINGGITPVSSEGLLRRYVASWWMNEAIKHTSIHHKMMFFLHTNWTINFDSGNSMQLFDYLELLRYYALGDFKALSVKMTLNNLMLRYLDGHNNKAVNPNDNYSREFLELFTIGKGPQIGPGDYTNYTEGDILEASKILTGFRATYSTDRMDYLDPVTGLPTGYPIYGNHDQTNKTFSSVFQNVTIIGANSESDMHRELGDFVTMIFNQDATARFICRKLYRFFVNKNITTEVEQDIIEPLATTFRTNNYSLETTVKQLLKSEHFYDADDTTSGDETIGALIKSPMELALSSMSFFQVDIPDPITDSDTHYNTWWRQGVQFDMFERAGFVFLKPDTVASYPAYHQEPEWNRLWFGSTSIIARYNYPAMLIKGKRFKSNTDIGAKIDMVAYVDNFSNISDPYNANTIVDELLNDLLCTPPDPQRRSYYLDVFLDGIALVDWVYEWADYVNTGDDTEVRIQLENLMTAIMYSPEFQLF